MSEEGISTGLNARRVLGSSSSGDDWVSKRSGDGSVGAIASLTDISAAHAATKSGTIKIGYVSPQTGALADFAGPDAFVLQQIKASSYFSKGIMIGGTKLQD